MDKLWTIFIWLLYCGFSLNDWTRVSAISLDISPAIKLRRSTQCLNNEYGDNCTYCVPSDTCSKGHYSCDFDTGNKLCLPGWTGESCRIKIEPDVTFVSCPDNQCRNGGSCISGGCCCIAGFTGILCEIEIIECTNESCQNGGICKDLIGRYECLCKDGFTGSQCEISPSSGQIQTTPYSDTNCQDSTCLNNGTCFEDEIFTYCLCPTWFTGERCETSVRTVQSATTNVTCPADYYGNSCETFCVGTDSCTDGHHVCDESTGQKVCKSGWIGDRCDTRQLPQTLDPDCPSGLGCKNDGQCYQGTCCCRNNYSGLLCQIESIGCLSGPCVNNGSCIEQDGAFSCQCESGYLGTFCEISFTSSSIAEPVSSTDLYNTLEISSLQDNNGGTVSSSSFQTDIQLLTPFQNTFTDGIYSTKATESQSTPSSLDIISTMSTSYESTRGYTPDITSSFDESLWNTGSASLNIMSTPFLNSDSLSIYQETITGLMSSDTITDKKSEVNSKFTSSSGNVIRTEPFPKASLSTGDIRFESTSSFFPSDKYSSFSSSVNYELSSFEMLTDAQFSQRKTTSRIIPSMSSSFNTEISSSSTPYDNSISLHTTYMDRSSSVTPLQGLMIQSQSGLLNSMITNTLFPNESFQISYDSDILPSFSHEIFSTQVEHETTESEIPTKGLDSTFKIIYTVDKFTTETYSIRPIVSSTDSMKSYDISMTETSRLDSISSSIPTDPFIMSTSSLPSSTFVSKVVNNSISDSKAFVSSTPSSYSSQSTRNTSLSQYLYSTIPNRETTVQLHTENLVDSINVYSLYENTQTTVSLEPTPSKLIAHFSSPYKQTFSVSETVSSVDLLYPSFLHTSSLPFSKQTFSVSVTLSEEISIPKTLFSEAFVFTSSFLNSISSSMLKEPFGVSKTQVSDNSIQSSSAQIEYLSYVSKETVTNPITVSITSTWSSNKSSFSSPIQVTSYPISVSTNSIFNTLEHLESSINVWTDSLHLPENGSKLTISPTRSAGPDSSVSITSRPDSLPSPTSFSNLSISSTKTATPDSSVVSISTARPSSQEFFSTDLASVYLDTNPVSKSNTDDHSLAWWAILIIVVIILVAGISFMLLLFIIVRKRKSDFRSIEQNPEAIVAYDKEHFSVQPEFANPTFEPEEDSDDDSVKHDIYVVNR